MSDVVVIGAGVIGSSIAFRLASNGYSVVLVDRAGPGAGASGACDKAIFLQSKRPGLHMELALASRNLYQELSAELAADIELRNDGGMVAIETPAHLEFMRGFVKQQQAAGIRVELLDGDTAREIQPVLAPHILGATHSPDDAEVNPLALNSAFFAAAVRAGAVVKTHTEVTGFSSKSGRVTGVQTTSGFLPTDLVINAAGPHAGHISRLANVDTPITPRRGCILISEAMTTQVKGNLLCAQYIAAKHLRDVAGSVVPPYGIGLSLGQTASGNLLIGGSREFVGFNKDVDPLVPAQIAKHAVRLVPALAQARIIRTMTGFRPSTADGLPIIGFARELEGFIIAAGHEGDGIALAPITSHLVRDLLVGSGPTHHFLAELDPQRFAYSNRTQASTL